MAYPCCSYGIALIVDAHTMAAGGNAIVDDKVLDDALRAPQVARQLVDEGAE